MAKQYMKYIAVGGVALEVNKEIEKGAKVILMVPFLQTDHCGSHTEGYNVLFEKEEEKNLRKSLEDEIAKTDEKIRLLKAELGIKAESKSNTSELKPCPFCGTEVKMQKVPLYGHAYPARFEFEVRCPKCGCTINYINNDSVYRSEEEAIANVAKAWNERKDIK